MDRCVATLCGRCSAWCSSEPDFSAAITGVAALAQDHGLAECAPVVRAHGVVIDNNVTFVKQSICHERYGTRRVAFVSSLDTEDFSGLNSEDRTDFLLSIFSAGVNYCSHQRKLQMDAAALMFSWQTSSEQSLRWLQ